VFNYLIISSGRRRSVVAISQEHSADTCWKGKFGAGVVVRLRTFVALFLGETNRHSPAFLFY